MGVPFRQFSFLHWRMSILTSNFRGASLRSSSLPYFTSAAALAVIAASVTAVSGTGFVDKVWAYSLILTGYLGSCGLVGVLRAASNWRASRESAVVVEPDLCILDELSTIFAGRLESPDAVRLAADRIRSLVPVESIVFYSLNNERSHVIERHSIGIRDQVSSERSKDLAQQVLSTHEFASDGRDVAAPLRNQGSVFGVLLLSTPDCLIGRDLAEGIAERLTPLLLGALALEHSRRSSLTDIVTDLPNERAFYLALEDHAARAGTSGAHSLTVLAIDIKGFDQINRQSGHIAGDKLLSTVGNLIRSELRQMDLLARLANDEFMVLLPKAGPDVAHEIVARIRESLCSQDIRAVNNQPARIELNVGWAALGSDGDTPGQLVTVAQLRKNQAKARSGVNVLWFPTSERIVR